MTRHVGQSDLSADLTAQACKAYIGDARAFLRFPHGQTPNESRKPSFRLGLRMLRHVHAVGQRAAHTHKGICCNTQKCRWVKTFEIRGTCRRLLMPVALDRFALNVRAVAMFPWNHVASFTSTMVSPGLYVFGFWFSCLWTGGRWAGRKIDGRRCRTTCRRAASVRE
jgi:hypothetical protein